MKKRLLLLTSFIGATSLFVALMPQRNIQQASAAYESKLVYTDKFDSGEISDNWITTDKVSLEKHYSSLRFDPTFYDWEADLILNKRVSGNFKVRVTLESHNNGGWFAVAFGLPNNGTQFYNAKGGIVFLDDCVELLRIKEGELTTDDNYLREGLSVFTSEVDVRRVMEITVSQVSASRSSIQCEIFENNISLGCVYDSPIVLNDSLNGYIGFNDNYKNVEIYNFELLSGTGESLYRDDFSESSILYPSTGSLGAEWYSAKFNEDDVKLGYVSSLYLEDIDEGVSYSRPLEEVKNTDVSIAYVLETEICYLPMDLGVESGFEIGKESTTSKGYFFGLRIIDGGGYSLISYGPNSTTETKLDYPLDPSDKTVSAKLTIYQNKEVEFKLGERVLSTTIGSYEGYCGLFNRNFSNDKSSASGAYFNSFNLTKDNYYERNATDLYQNFNGVRRRKVFEDLDIYVTNYFVPKSEWTMGTNVGLSTYNSEDQGNGKLEFDKASGSSFFGPKKMYKDFVVKFDVEIISPYIPHGGTLGLEFGNSRNGLLYDNAQSLGVGYYSDKSGHYYTVPVIHNVNYADGASHDFLDDEGQPINFLENPGKFTLMYVARNNVVSLYYLLDGQDESELSKVRTSVVCKDYHSTDGYLAIFGTNGISFSIDNVSIINLDYETPASEYKGESNYQEVTRKDFITSNDIKGLTLSGGQYLNNKYRLSENGEIKTSKLVNDFILRLKLKDVENTLTINQDKLIVQIINKKDKSIVVNDGTTQTTTNLPSTFDFMNSYLEVEKIGTHLNVRFAQGNTPLSTFENDVFSYEIAKTSDSILSIKSENGFTDIVSYHFINLNKHVTIISRNYNPETDDFDPWPYRPTSNSGQSSGCSGDAGKPSLLITGIACVALIGLRLLKRRNKNEK